MRKTLAKLCLGRLIEALEALRRVFGAMAGSKGLWTGTLQRLEAFFGELTRGSKPLVLW